jgi:hypothetical protein
MKMTYFPARIIAAAALGGASAPSHSLGVCPIMAAPDRHVGQTMTIEGYVIVGNHGVHMLEPGCEYEINLVWSDRDFRGRRAFLRIVRQLRGERMMVRLRATGTFQNPQPSEEPRNEDGLRIEDCLICLLGPYLDLAEVEVMTAQRLSRLDARRYQNWLEDPGSGPFRPSGSERE